MIQELIEKIKNFININDFFNAKKLLDTIKNEDNPLILYYRGFTNHKLGNNKEAIENLKKIKTEIPEVFFLMANILEDLSKELDAIKYLEKTVSLKPKYWQAFFNLGKLYLKIKEFKKSKESFKEVLKIDPNNTKSMHYLGVLYAKTKDLVKAQKQLEKVLSIDPNNEKSHMELSEILLGTGNLKYGWEEYMWKFNYLENVYPEQIKKIPIWDGKNIEKNTFLIFREQGFGDEVLYASCYNNLIRKAKKCVFISDDRLVNLFKNSFPKANFIGEKIFSKNTDLSQINPSARLQAPMIPKFFRNKFSDFPKQKKYLIPKKINEERWKKKLLKYKKKLKIGLAWRSSSKLNNKIEKRQEEKNSLKEPIFFDLNEWKDFLSIENICLINLMYHCAKKEINEFNLSAKSKIINFDDLDLKNEIDDVAALITNLDIVISAQTWIGDFSAALGVEVYKFHNIYSKTRLGQKNIPWNNSIIFETKNGNWKDSFKLIKSLLNNKKRKLINIK